MAATAAFWSATAVAVALDAENTAAPNAGSPVAPLLATVFDGGAVIKSNF